MVGYQLVRTVLVLGLLTGWCATAARISPFGPKRDPYTTVPLSMREPHRARQLRAHEPHFELTDRLAAMKPESIHHGRTAVRRLTESDCAATAAAAGIDLTQCFSSNLRMSGQVARQFMDVNGTIHQYTGLSVDAVSVNGGRVCGCAGIAQSGNRPNGGAAYDRAAVFSIRGPILAYDFRKVGYVPPHVATNEVGVYSSSGTPAGTNVTASMPVTTAYTASLKAYLEWLVTQDASRRRLSREPGPRRAWVVSASHDASVGRVLHDAPLHSDVGVPTMLSVMARLREAAAAARMDARTDAESTAFLNGDGVPALQIIDPLGGYMPAYTGPTKSFPELMASLPYVAPSIIARSEAAVGSHMTVRLAWAFTAHDSADRHLAEAGFTNTYDHDLPRDQLTFLDTIADSPELFESVAYEGAHAMMHPQERRRQLWVAEAVATAALATASAALVISRQNQAAISDLSDKADNIESGLDSAERALQWQRNATDSLLASSELQNRQIGNLTQATGRLTEGLSDLEEWRRGLDSSASATADLNARMSEQLRNETLATQARLANMSASIVSANAALEALLEGASTQCDINVRDTAALTSRSIQQLATAITTLATDIDTKLRAMANHVGLTSRVLNRMFTTLQRAINQDEMFNDLTASMYAYVRFMQGKGWRPIWHAASLDERLWPDDLRRWQDGSPQRAVVVESIMTIRTHRVRDVHTGAYPTTDIYSPTGAAVTAAANHRAVEDTLTFVCDIVSILDVATSTQTATTVMDAIGPTAGCARPVAGMTVDEFVGNYTGATPTAVYNAAGLPLCNCWVVHRRRSCPVVLRNASHPTISTSMTAQNRVTFFGLDGMTVDGVRHFTPCATDATPVVDSHEVLTDRTAVTVLLGTLSCGDDAAKRNVTPGAIQARTAGDTVLESQLVDTYVFSLQKSMQASPTVWVTAANGSLVLAPDGPTPTLSTAVAFGIAVPVNPKTEPRPVYGPVTSGTCSGDPDEVASYSIATVPSFFYLFLMEAWGTVVSSSAATRIRVYGAPTSDVSTRTEIFNFDPATKGHFVAMYARLTMVQDAATPWVPVFQLERRGAPRSVATMYMKGLNATSEGADNAVSAFRTSTTEIESFIPMASVFPARFIIVGDIENCVTGPCDMPQVGTFFNISRGPFSYLYNPSQRDISLATNKRMSANRIGNVLDTDTRVINGSVVALSRRWTGDTFEEQNPGQKLDASAAAGSIAPTIRIVTQVTPPTSSSDVYCPGFTSVDEGDLCLQLEHGVWFTADLGGADADLIGTEYEGCGTSIVCVIPREFMQRILNLDVPGGEMRQTLGNVCPFVDPSMQGLGLPTISVTLPPTAATASRWQYRFVCNGVDDAIDDPGMSNGERTTLCNNARTPIFVDGGSLDPGSTTTIPFMSTIANWTMQIRTRNPLDGIDTTCRSVAFFRKTTTMAPLFGETAITFAPVLSNARTEAQLESLGQGIGGLSDGLIQSMSTLQLQLNFVLDSSGQREDFDSLIANITDDDPAAWDLTAFYAAQQALGNISADAIQEAQRVAAVYRNVSAGFTGVAVLTANLSRVMDAKVNQSLSEARAATSRALALNDDIAALHAQARYAQNQTTYELSEMRRYLDIAGNITVRTGSSFGFLTGLVNGIVDLAGDALNAAKSGVSFFGSITAFFRRLLLSFLHIVILFAFFLSLWWLWKTCIPAKSNGYATVGVVPVGTSV